MRDPYEDALSNLLATMETPRSRKATATWAAAMDLFKSAPTCAMAHPEKPTLPRWRCQDCGSTDIHVSFPTWYGEVVAKHRTGEASDLQYVDVDSEASPSFFCSACDSTDSPYDLTDDYEYRASVRAHGKVKR